MPFMFENLEVYRRAVDVADTTIRISEKFPKGYYFLADQLNRAALSISTNIAEGNGRFTKADRKNFFIIARGSIQECIPLLEITQRRKFINHAEHNKLYDELEILSKMLNGLIKGIDKRTQ